MLYLSEELNKIYRNKLLIKSIIVLIAIFYSGILYSKPLNDSIIFKDDNYFFRETYISLNDVNDLLRKNEQSKKYINLSNSQLTLGGLVLTAGSVLTVYSVIKGIGEKKFADTFKGNNLLLLASSLSIDVIGIYILKMSQDNFKLALKTYNKTAFVSTGYLKEINFNISLTSIGISFEF
jgi:hypothetical protein